MNISQAPEQIDKQFGVLQDIFALDQSFRIPQLVQ